MDTFMVDGALIEWVARVMCKADGESTEELWYPGSRKPVRYVDPCSGNERAALYAKETLVSSRDRHA